MSCVAVSVLRQSRRRQCQTRRVAAQAQANPGAEAAVGVPRGPEETAQQALAACVRAYKDGVLRHRVELLLPLIGATDLDDWPGGVQQQFKVQAQINPGLISLLLNPAWGCIQLINPHPASRLPTLPAPLLLLLL